MYYHPEKYRDYVKALNLACQSLQQDSRAQLVVVCGADDYLVTRSSQALANSWQQQHQIAPTSVEGEKIDREAFFDLVKSRGLFEPSSLYVIKRAERCQELPSWLKMLGAQSLQDNSLIINIHRPALGAPLSKALASLGATTITCHHPHESQLPKFIEAIAKKCGISLSAEATSLMITNLGDDLSRIDNEVKKLSLIFAQLEGVLSADVIAPHLGLLREDEAFAIDDLLTSQQFGKAHLLLDDLIERGQSPLAILGILSRYCRNLLAVSTAKKIGHSPKQIAVELKIPIPVIRKYMTAVNHTSIKRAQRALIACQECDHALKSSRLPANLTLSVVIDELAACSR